MRADRDAGERGAFMHDALKFWLYALLDGGDDDRGGAADRGCGRCCGCRTIPTTLVLGGRVAWMVRGVGVCACRHACQT